MKYLKIILLFIFSTFALFAKDEFKKIRLYNSNSNYSTIIDKLDLESALIKQNIWVEVIVNQFELQKIKDANLQFEELELNNQPINQTFDKSNTIQSLKYFKFGKLGGFYTLTESFKIYDDLMIKFPDLIEKTTIGKSVENRDLYCYVFHNKLNSIDTASVLLTALHHAREPLGLTTLTYFLCDLLEKFESGDIDVNYLLSYTKIYVVPVINPDSYLANQTADTIGGGLIRKNQARKNGKYAGVDLNRNYGPYDLWDSPVGGSGIVVTDETYRGDNPFSEPETIAIRDLALSHKFLTSINYHSYGNMVIHPWKAFQDNPDSSLFQSICFNSTESSNNIYGWDLRSVGYFARGNSDEWLYSKDLNKNSTISVTPEIGTSINGFWGYTREDILKYGKDNLKLNYNALWSAIDNLALYNYEFDCETNILKVKFRNIGVNETFSQNIIIAASNKYLAFDSSFNISKLKKNADTTISIPISFNTGFNNGDLVNFSISHFANNNKYRNQSFIIQLGNCYNEYLFKTNELSADWSSKFWGLEIDLESKALVLNDSPYTTYADSTKNYINYNKEIHLSQDTIYNLVYDTRWNIEREFDFATTEVFSDVTNQWNYLTSSRSVAGSMAKNSPQTAGSFGLHGNVFEWTRQSCDLNKFVNQNFNLRFGVLSDIGNHYEGFYLKNIRIEKFPKKILTNIEPIEQDDKVIFNLENNYLKLNPNCDIEIINLLGQSIKSFSQINEIDLSFLESNVYFIILKNGNKTKFIKLIKN